MAVLDKKICEALSYADEVVDVKKDETIEGIVSVKKTINTLGPVQAVVVGGERTRAVLFRRLCVCIVDGTSEVAGFDTVCAAFKAFKAWSGSSSLTNGHDFVSCFLDYFSWQFVVELFNNEIQIDSPLIRTTCVRLEVSLNKALPSCCASPLSLGRMTTKSNPNC